MPDAAAPLRIWCDIKMTAGAARALENRLAPHEVAWAEEVQAMNEPTGRASARLENAAIAFGQPEVAACLAARDLRWIHLTSAGWDRFDRTDVREPLRARGVALTTSSSVYAEPCAQHALAFMLADARQLPRSLRHQATDHAWPHLPTRAGCALLGPGDTVVLVGFGTIALRLVQLLSPFGVRVVGVRRAPTGREPVPVVRLDELMRILPSADHVVNILPGGPETRHVFDARVLGAMKPGAVFYNIGRGSTVDENALAAALERGHLRAAYLDVTEQEPLPVEHPLWKAPHCVITPHAAGGHATEQARLLDHFVNNLGAWVAGEKLSDRTI